MTPYATYESYEDLLRASVQATADGWHVFDADFPEEGAVGVMLYRYTCEGRVVDRAAHDPSAGELLEEHRWYVWRPFGNLVLNERVIYRGDPVDLVALLNELASKQLFKADDPKALRIGFVYYEDGVAHVTRIPLSLIKAGPIVVAGQPFAAWRDSLPSLRKLAAASTPS